MRSRDITRAWYPPFRSRDSTLGREFVKHEPPGISEQRQKSLPVGCQIRRCGVVSQCQPAHTKYPRVVASVTQGAAHVNVAYCALGGLRLSNHARGMRFLRACRI